MKTKLFLLLTIFIAGMVFSCGKKNDTAPATNEHLASVSDFLTKNGAPTQIFTLDAASGGVIIGSYGTKITFPAYAFKHLNGSIITGNVSVLLREVYKKSDMLLSNLSTMNGTKPLKSGGMLSITAFQGNEQLYMANGKSYSAEMPASIPDNSLRAFIGFPDSSGRNWSTVDSVLYDTTGWGVSSFYAQMFGEVNSYLYSTNWLGWINCDTWVGASYPVIEAEATLSNSDFGTECFIIMDDNSAIGLYPNSLNGFANNAPMDSSGTLVALGVKDSVLYSAFVPFTVTNNLHVSFTLHQTTTDEFKAALDLLN